MITDIGGGIDQAMALAQDADGKLLAAGYGFYGGFGSIALVRYLSDGTLDAGFGVGGIAEEFIGGDDHGKAVAVQPDGKILVAGSSEYVDSYDVVVLRFDGGVAESFQEASPPRPMAVQPNPCGGELVVSGTSGRGRIIVYDLMGRPVLSSRAMENRTRMDVSSLVPGEYVLIHDEDGRLARSRFAKR